ncbi:MAG: phosphotransferase family protein [Gammaproteobacteria bacterium]|nr:phosphotransferase family protein [Gammaproteobacteria bacterium]
MSQSELETLFARIPLLESQTPADFSITPLPGYTNRNYRLRNQQHDWVLRVPQVATDRFIDRAAEAANQVKACDLGLAPRPLWRDRSGLTLTPTLTATRSPASADLTDDASLQLILGSVRKLHRSGLTFQGRVQLGELLSRYYSIINQSLQSKFRQRIEAARRLLPLLDERDCLYVASHNDLVLENLLLEQNRLWLIDWEFSSMASPYWDLATICNAANLDYRQSRHLLDIYCADGKQMEESLLFDYRNLLQLLGDCWMAALANQ